MKKYIVQIGNAPSSLGGITTVIKMIMNSKSLSEYSFKLLVTSAEKKKIWVFIKGFIEYFILCITGRVSIAHIHMSERGSCYRKAFMIRLSAIFRIPIVLHSHGSNFHTFYDELDLKTKKWFKNSFNKVTNVIVLTDSWKNYWLDIVDEEKVLILPNCVSIPENSNKKIYNSKLHILFLGRLGERKGVYDLIKAAKILRENSINFVMNLCGDGEIEKCKDLVKTLGVEENVYIRGWIDGNDKEKFLKDSDILILPSYYESFGIVLLEGMVHRLAIICSNGGAMKEIISDEVDGFVINYGSPEDISLSIKKFVENPKLLNVFGENGYRKVIDKYSEKVVMDDLKKIYDTILK